MKTELLLVSLLALAGVALFMQGGSMESTTSTFTQYQNWKLQHGINFAESEEAFRLSVWLKNFEFVQKHNQEAAAEGASLRLGMTPFAAMELEEYIAQKTTELQKVDRSGFQTATFENTADLPSSVNWVTAGAVTPVQNQGSCGSCWAFSTVAGLEGLKFQKTGTLTKLSEQQVLSCVPAPFSLGCGGGNTIFAYTYTSIAGIETEAAYPYTDGTTGKTSPCEYNKSDVVYQNDGVKVVPANDPKAFQAALSEQVVSVSVDAANIYFQLYQGGVMDNAKCGSNLDHAITAVGYDMSAPTPYWYVKNSWGASWGEKGYILIGVSEGDGVCGINMDNTYPTA